ncbi:MAG: NAD(P)-dependent oxidoreductase [Dehalococcoidia bacterium]|nr:NAD(P)-dependent oxidoreductase [Dehalococcoidia bacterium]
MNNKRVLITGAAGFIGANLVRELLGQGARVHAIVRPATKLWRFAGIASELTLHTGDLTDGERLREIVGEVRPEIIFNLAARGIVHSERNRWETVRTNVLCTANLLEVTSQIDYQRLVHVGSSTEYGANSKPMKESDRLEPLTLFGASKAAASLLCQQVSRTEKRPIVVLRPFSVYGHWEPPTRLIPTAILAVLRNQTIDLTSPRYRRDFIFVEDVTEACILAALSDKAVGQILNIGTGRQWNNEEVVSMVQDVLGQKVEVRVGNFPPRVSDTDNWVSDTRKTRRLLSWEPHHSLHSGIEKSAAWFRQRLSAYGVS